MATLGLGLWVGVSWGLMALINAGMAWRSWLYWSSIACDGASVGAVGDGEGVERSSTGLVEEASLFGGAGWQFLTSGSGVGDGGGGVCSWLMDSGGCWAVWRHRQSSRVD